MSYNIRIQLGHILFQVQVYFILSSPQDSPHLNSQQHICSTARMSIFLQSTCLHWSSLSSLQLGRPTAPFTYLHLCNQCVKIVLLSRIVDECAGHDHITLHCSGLGGVATDAGTLPTLRLSPWKAPNMSSLRPGTVERTIPLKSRVKFVFGEELCFGIRLLES